MRRSSRVIIAVAGIVWVLALGSLVVWHKIWAPVLVVEDAQVGGRTDIFADIPHQVGTSFTDDFDGVYRARSDQIDLHHPLHGVFKFKADWAQIHAHDGSVELRSGAFMQDIKPAGDCTVSLKFQQSRGGDRSAAVVVALLARCGDKTKPYQSGYAFEWDMHDGKQRIWGGGEVLVERDAPGDTALHTMSFELQGESLRGSVDGQPVLEAEDSRYETGIVGFGGNGRPCVVFDSFALKRPDDAGGHAAGPLDVGVPFDLREGFDVVAGAGGGTRYLIGGPSLAAGATSYTGNWGGADAGTVERHLPRHVVSSCNNSGASYGFAYRYRTHTSTHGDLVAFSNMVMCLIDSKNAADCTVRTLFGDIVGRFPYPETLSRNRRKSDVSASLLVRVQKPDYPWAGCYCLTYNWQRNELQLVRHDQAGPPRPGHWPPQIPVKSEVLATATGSNWHPEAELWLSAEGAQITGGLDDKTLVSATDTSYPSGYVGFGSLPETSAVFQWVEMRGGQ